MLLLCALLLYLYYSWTLFFLQFRLLINTYLKNEYSVHLLKKKENAHFQMFSFVWIYFMNIHQSSAILRLNGSMAKWFKLLYSMPKIKYIKTLWWPSDYLLSKYRHWHRPLKNAYWPTSNRPYVVWSSQHVTLNATLVDRILKLPAVVEVLYPSDYKTDSAEMRYSQTQLDSTNYFWRAKKLFKNKSKL